MALSLTYEELLNLQSGLNKIATLSEKESDTLEFKLKWRASRIIKKLNPEVQEFTEKRQELLQKYGTEIFTASTDKVDKDGTPIKESTQQFNLGDNTKEYNTKVKEMLKEPVTLEGNVFKFKLSDLKKIKGLAVNDYVSLDPIIDEDIDVDSDETDVESAEKADVLRVAELPAK